MKDQFLLSIQGKQLRELQLCELEILKDFIKVCNRLKLTWYLCGGTLLGCVRHKGFIPWDDDIDICMPRKDYEIFMKKGQNYLKESYFVQNHITDSEYTNCYAKIRDSNTTFVEYTCRRQNINHGVYIDIFPLDNFNANKKIQNKLADIKYAINKIPVRISYLRVPNKKNKMENILIKINNSTFSKLANINMIQKSIKKNEKIAKTYQNEKTSHYKMYHTNSECKQCEKTIFNHGKSLSFENIKVQVPTNYDQYLTQNYGNYMQLPPKSERIGHHYVSEFNLTKSYKERISTNV